MKTIYKYQLEIEDEQEAIMPEGAEILTCQMQNGHACLWALVDVVAKPGKKRVAIFGTGHQITCRYDEVLKYIDTFQMDNGSLVFHCFEVL